MDVLEVSGVRIAGVSACLPENRIDNRDACASLFGDSIDTVIKATGIRTRYVADPGTSSLDLGILAAQELLSKTGTDPGQIGAVVCVTFTPEHLMPADSTKAQARLGLPNECVAFDVNMACSGYGYGLYLGATLSRALGKRVLVLDSDVQTAYVSTQDKATAPILSDAGTATLLEPSSDETVWKFAFYTDGSGYGALYIPAGGTKHPINPGDLVYAEREDGSYRRDSDIYMDGFAIFRFVAQEASKFIAGFMEQCELRPGELDVFVPHQANMYMIDRLAKKLGFPADRVWRSGDDFGNPASASIPLTIAANGKRWFSGHDAARVLLSGFGGGLSVSVACVDLPRDGYYSVIQKER